MGPTINNVFICKRRAKLTRLDGATSCHRGFLAAAPSCTHLRSFPAPHDRTRTKIHGIQNDADWLSADGLLLLVIFSSEHFQLYIEVTSGQEYWKH